MPSLAILSVLVLLPYCTVGCSHGKAKLQEDTIDRLTKVEHILERVLAKNDALEKKNGELQRRIEDLENDNQPLKYSENIRKRAERERRLVLSEDPTVAFTATISTPRLVNLGQNAPVVYDHVVTNEGGAYSSATGVFTAPMGGVYAFNVDTMIDTGNSQYLRLVMDGNEVIPSFTHGAGEVHLMTSSRTTTLRVKAGSKVAVRTFDASWHGNGTVHGNNFSSFSGWLLAYTE